MNTSNQILLMRYNTDGSLDTTLVGDSGRGNGIVYLESRAELSVTRAIALQPDGKIVVAGQLLDNDDIDPDAKYEFGLIRFNTDGTLDAETFGPTTP